MSIFNSNMGVLDVERLLVNQKKILEFLINGESVDDVNEYINTELRGASSYKIKHDKKQQNFKIYRNFLENIFLMHIRKTTKNYTHMKLFVFKFILDNLFKDKQQLPECMTEYTNTPVDIDFQMDLPFEIHRFTCWGIGHDCLITTSDGVRCRWDFKK